MTGTLGQSVIVEPRWCHRQLTTDLVAKSRPDVAADRGTTSQNQSHCKREFGPDEGTSRRTPFSGGVLDVRAQRTAGENVAEVLLSNSPGQPGKPQLRGYVGGGVSWGDAQSGGKDRHGDGVVQDTGRAGRPDGIGPIWFTPTSGMPVQNAACIVRVTGDTAGVAPDISKEAGYPISPSTSRPDKAKAPQPIVTSRRAPQSPKIQDVHRPGHRGRGSGSEVGSFCRRGRRWGEIISFATGGRRRQIDGRRVVIRSARGRHPALPHWTSLLAIPSLDLRRHLFTEDLHLVDRSCTELAAK